MSLKSILVYRGDPKGRKPGRHIVTYHFLYLDSREVVRRVHTISFNRVTKNWQNVINCKILETREVRNLFKLWKGSSKRFEEFRREPNASNSRNQERRQIQSNSGDMRLRVVPDSRRGGNSR